MFAVGLALGARTTELWLVRVDQFKEEIVKSKSAFVYYPKVGSRCGESKNHSGGIKYVKYKPRRIPIHDVTLLNGKLNVFHLIQNYFAVRRLRNLGKDRFFLGVNQGRKNDVSAFLKAQPISRNARSKIVKEVCLSLDIRGEGANNYVTTYGLRATMISLLISSGHSDATVVLRSGHRDNNSLQSYHNLISRNGKQQLAAVFGCSSGFIVSERRKLLTHSERDFAADGEQKELKLEEKPAEKKPRVEDLTSTSWAMFASNFTPNNCTINVNVLKD